MGQQGWHADPWGRYEHRWFSQGTPTALVRTGRVEARDEPDGTPPPPPAPQALIEHPPPRAPRLVWEEMVTRRPWRARIVLAAAFVVPVLGTLLLAPSDGNRVTVVALFAVAYVSLGTLVLASRHGKSSTTHKSATP
jgi:hypothetical protein